MLHTDIGLTFTESRALYNQKWNVKAVTELTAVAFPYCRCLFLRTKEFSCFNHCASLLGCNYIFAVILHFHRVKVLKNTALKLFLGVLISWQLCSQTVGGAPRKKMLEWHKEVWVIALKMSSQRWWHVSNVLMLTVWYHGKIGLDWSGFISMEQLNMSLWCDNRTAEC